MLGRLFLSDYLKHKSQFIKIFRIHQKGYAWDDWHVNNLTKNSCEEYLCTAEYYALHPLNSLYSHWIDDKLTLKYLCAGTMLDKYMPKYYYQINENGDVLALPDIQDKKNSYCKVEEIVSLLEGSGELAMKRIYGSCGEGFYKAAYKEENYYLNDKVYSKDELLKTIEGMRNYLVTEYLHPHVDLVPFCADTANCIRYLIGRNSSGEMKMIKSYIRLGTKASGYVENYNAGGVLCYIEEDGVFKNGNIFNIQSRTNKVVTEHPDTLYKLEGKIPNWDKVQIAADNIGNYFPQMQYLGIDFVITNKNEIKILEINSLTSLDTIQLDGSILKKRQGEFYRKALKSI